MRRSADRPLIAFGRMPVVAVGLAGVLFLTGCATQVAGTALPPTSIPQIPATSTVASMPTGTPTRSSDSAETSSSAEVSSSVETSSSATSGSATPSSEMSTTEPSSSDTYTSEPSTATGPTVQPAAFGAKLKAANAGVKSMKGSISVVAGKADVSGTFGETVSAGRVDALDMAMFITAGASETSLRVLIVGRKIYLGGATALQSLDVSQKWALASKDSKNANLRALAAQLDGYLTTTSAQQYELYAAAAKTVVDGGEERIGTVAAHRYIISVDVAALAKLSPASSRASMEALASAGVTTIPTTLWLDSSDRLVQSVTTVKVSGITSRSELKVSAYNTPVIVKAPPPADVFTG